MLSCRYMFCDHNKLLQCCETLLLALPDYHMSAKSIYQRNALCPRFLGHFCQKQNSQLSALRSRGSFVQIESQFKFFQNDDYQSQHRLVSILSSYKKSLTSNRIILSLCAGSGGTELQSSSLCLCLDLCRRSLFSGAFSAKHLHKSKSVVFYRHDMKYGLFSLFKAIQEHLAIPIVVLFQHPSPNNDRAISLAGEQCCNALIKGIVSQIHTVFDMNSGKTCWTYQNLVSRMVADQFSTMVHVSEGVLICESNKVDYDHPVLGYVKRSGWSSHKKGQEIAFCITKK